MAQYTATSTKSNETKIIIAKNNILAKRKATAAFRGHGWQTITLRDSFDTVVATKHTENIRWKNI